MRDQPWYTAALIGVMCLLRFGLSTIGYANPSWLMEQLGMPIDLNIQMPYVIRVWAIRDMVLAGVVASANKNTVKTLLFACIVIDVTDVISAQLSSAAGLFNASDTWSLKLTAISALVPEFIALIVLFVTRKTDQQTDPT
ncbi:MAG: hypothetical protein AAGF01_29860 [Cyanobacteria bacterium P01_G01_bin.38]